ncbi:MAG: preprotein translocase subunit YajC [Candidatus Omnitrophica bacterium]|nr:preprotein translocase subunit YajC [Candidatus Omnitrophota bacterium]MCM8800114.1 preprotein translocase subunit YajC [Candidatus Omnitrophota bacterium]
MSTNPTVNPLINLFPIVIIFLIFYLLIIKPQKEREKQHKKMLDELNKNDEVVTSSGIHGVIVNIKEKTVILRIDDNVKVELEKDCIAYVKKKNA